MTCPSAFIRQICSAVLAAGAHLQSIVCLISMLHPRFARIYAATILVGCGVMSSSARAEVSANAGWQKELAAYNVAWTSPSKGSHESMPLSGGVLGLNVWSEDGDICFLMGSPNCMDEKGMQVKLGLVRLHFEPTVFEKDFRQELQLGRSEIIVSGKTAAGSPVAVKLWCGVNEPLIHAEMDAGEPVVVTATYETWSDYKAQTENGEVQWFRRLADKNARRKRDLKTQGMAEFEKSVPDPLSRLTTGGCITGSGMVSAGAGTGTFNKMPTRTYAIKTASAVRQLDLCITLRMEQDKSLTDWKYALARDAAQALQNSKADRAASLAWWAGFWNRSYISLRPGADPADNVWQAGRNYQLIRYMYASNIRGRAPTLFNGGSFTCTGNPDQRTWESCQFMGQNQRLSYWPMLRSGDYDVLKVATDFYRDRTEMSQLHAKKFWGIDGGVAWSEPFSIFGLDSLGTNADGRCNRRHLSYHYTSGMEFALMMLELERYTGKAYPGYHEGAKGVIRYYDQYYQKAHAKNSGHPLNEAGHLVIYPSDACEPYHGCTNNTDVLAGLHALTSGLLNLPAGTLSMAERVYFEEFQKRIPPFGMKEKDGRKYFAAADSWEWVHNSLNMDFPQMYVCFPFNILSLGRSDMALAKNTFELSAVNPAVQHQNQAWYQTAINYARMGDVPQARKLVLEKLLHRSERFSTFFQTFYSNGKPNFGHTPDMDQCGTSMIGLQEMLMQTDGKRILLAPAWPADWDCEFKLHAPYETTVEGRISQGKVTVIRVTPESRRGDIEMFTPAAVPQSPVSEGKSAQASSVWSADYEAKKALDGDPATRWAGRGQQAWLEVDLGAPRVITRAVIDEASYPQVTRFTLEAKQVDGTWKTLVGGDKIGPAKSLAIPATEAQIFRLNILQLNGDGPNINEFQLF